MPNPGCMGGDPSIDVLAFQKFLWLSRYVRARVVMMKNYVPFLLFPNFLNGFWQKKKKSILNSTRLSALL